MDVGGACSTTEFISALKEELGNRRRMGVGTTDTTADL